MKTLVKQFGKNKALFFSITMLLLFFAGNPAFGRSHYGSKDSLSFIIISGKIVDKETNKPVMFANIVINGTSIGTVTNADGEYILKVPKEKQNEAISVSHLGYKNYKTAVSKIRSGESTIILEPELVPLQEVIVRNEDPITLLRGAIRNIPKNYRTDPVMVTGFYREAIQQNRRYVSIAEAVLEAYKAPYDGFQDDKVKILIGRKSQDVKKMDTLLVKLQGGPVTPFILDIVKNPENILSEDYFQYYNYTIAGQVSLDDIRCYVINFDQRPDVNIPLYKGKIYLGIDNLEIVGLEFSISDVALPNASSLFVRKKPLTLKFETLGANYFVKYAKYNGLWSLNYVRSELKFKCKWHKKLFSSNYSMMLEMAVTGMDTANINKFKNKETTKFSDVFSDEANAFKNDEFWGDYNIIKPEESIQSAIEKLNKKLKKR